jgi:outer membrane protein W
MTQRIYRILFLLFIVAGSVRLSAQTQSSEVGGWILFSRFDDSTLLDEQDEFRIEFDDKTGFGVSFNQYWTEQFSTEIAAQKYSADMTMSTSLVPGETFEIGEIDVTSITAMVQWHFNRAGRFAPYVSGGVAHLSGDLTVVDVFDVEETSDLESEIGIAAAVGANIRLTERLFLATEVKYTPWSAIAEEDESREEFDLNPLVLAVGLKARF